MPVPSPQGKISPVNESRSAVETTDPAPPLRLPLMDDLQEVFVREDSLRRRVRELGTQISEAFAGEEELTVISVINGAIIFSADLVRRLTVPIRMDCIRVQTYRNASEPVQEPEIIDQLRLDIQHRPVLLIDDIYDTGRTLTSVLAILRDLQPRKLKTCVLLEKLGRRERSERPDFVGFRIPDRFVVGYGLDFAERYRNLPCIGVLRPELQNPPEWR